MSNTLSAQADTLLVSLSGSISFKLEHIEFTAHRGIIDQIVDWFGNEVHFKEIDKDYVSVSIKASPNAMEHWAMQYINYVEVIKPLSLRECIKNNIERANNKYR